MYAIIAENGRQYKVEEGQVFQIDLRDDVGAGDSVTFSKVLLIGGGEKPIVGVPVVEGASVTAEVVAQELGDKIYIQKFRRRKNYRRRTGHRQMYTRVKITKISV
ncbi:ribosomal protein L21 [Pirellula staleyi DSM 6068]|uniref:Large ribosomal subunit protein bL21 n=1 Tax=Pirellula staleyi (strain ATCC 27377 / DSM 6068 / ICPB 4128) TaxID=530564 RepID=D2R4P0_PIRSD|nr:50S ribosomal protein L21 [Pirellula staleyi]ADB17106.1 ribosomal protein L21 [Pirellula staleyi DSM 6068]